MRATRVIAFAVVLAACGNDRGAKILGASVPAVVDRDVDMLLMVVDDFSVASWQQSLGAAWPAFVTAMSGSDGRLPNLQVGVITSDLGTSSADDPPAPSIGAGQEGGCVGSGDGGAMKTFGAQVNAPYLIDIHNADGTTTTNFTGDFSVVMGQILTGVGVNGCVFEQHLAAVTAAFTNPANTGFRRDNANLVVILLTDQDDCSARSAGFFGDDTTLGPLSEFRCASQGITCDQAIDDIGDNKTNCVPREDSDFVTGVQPFIDAMRGFDPRKLYVAGIVGPATPVSVELRAPGPGDTPIDALAHSCNVTDPQGSIAVANPTVRDTAWVNALGGDTFSICANDYTPYVRAIAAKITSLIEGQHCLDDAIDPDTCVAFEYADQPVDAPRLPIPRCGSDASTGDCFEIDATAGCAHDVVVHSTAAQSHVDVSCDSPSP